MPKLLLNLVSVSTAPDARVVVGKQPFDKETLAFLRGKHRGEYLVKRGGEDGNSILAVALRPELGPLGKETEDQQLSKAPWLLAPLLFESLIRLFEGMGRPILKWRPLRILSLQPANIFPAESGLPRWLQRRVVLNFETRIIQRQDKDPVVVLACGVSTRNIIDVSCKELLDSHIPLLGRYVAAKCSADDPRIQNYLRLAGRVAAVRGSQLTLEDHGEASATIDVADAFLEARNENVAWCVKHLLGARRTAFSVKLKTRRVGI